MEEGLQKNFEQILILSGESAKKKSKESINRFIDSSFYSFFPECIPQTFFSLQKRRLKIVFPNFLKRKISLRKIFDFLLVYITKNNIWLIYNI